MPSNERRPLHEGNDPWIGVFRGHTIHRGRLGVCDPNNPKNRRSRPSILLEHGETRVLVDTAPDLREQLIREQVTEIDAVILSHAHADHLHGIDDLRGLNRRMNRSIDLWTDEATLDSVDRRFPYVLAPLREGATMYYKPTVNAHCYEAFEAFRIGDVEVLPVSQDHGFSKTHGYRFGNLAYTTDLVRFPEDSLAALTGIETWIVGAFSWDPHPTHLHVDGVLEIREKLKPHRTIITHLSAKIDHQVLTDYLPEGWSPPTTGW